MPTHEVLARDVGRVFREIGVTAFEREVLQRVVSSILTPNSESTDPNLGSNR